MTWDYLSVICSRFIVFTLICLSIMINSCGPVVGSTKHKMDHYSLDNMDLNKLQELARLLQDHQLQQEQGQDDYHLHLSPVDQTIVKQEMGMTDTGTPLPSQTPPPHSLEAWQVQLGNTPLVKTQPCDSSTSQTKSLLKQSIQSRRRSKGQPDFQGHDLFELRQAPKLTAADRERRERRREQNRRAARKCRNKRKEAQEKNMQDIADAMTRKELLEKEVGNLRKELAQLCQIISAHTTSGCCLIPNDGTTHALLSALSTHQQPYLSDSGLGDDLGDETNVDILGVEEPSSFLFQLGSDEQYDLATAREVTSPPAANTTSTISRKRKIPPSPLTVSAHLLPNKRVCRTSTDCQIVPSTSPNLRKTETLSPLTPTAATSPHVSNHHISSCNNNINVMTNSTDNNNMFTPTYKHSTPQAQIFNFENVAPVISPTVHSEISDNPWPVTTPQPGTGLASIGFEMMEQQMYSFDAESEVPTMEKQPHNSHMSSNNNLPSWDWPNLEPLDLPGFADRTRLMDTTLINIPQPKQTSASNSVLGNKTSCVRDLSKDFTACRPPASSTPRPALPNSFLHVSTPAPLTNIDESGSGLLLPPSYTSTIMTPNSTLTPPNSTHTIPNSTPVVSVGELLSQDPSSMACVSPAMVQPYNLLPHTDNINSNIRQNEKNSINCNSNINNGSYTINDNLNSIAHAHNLINNNGSQELQQLRQLLRQHQTSSFLAGQPNFLEPDRPSS